MRVTHLKLNPVSQTEPQELLRKHRRDHHTKNVVWKTGMLEDGLDIYVITSRNWKINLQNTFILFQKIELNLTPGATVTNEIFPWNLKI